MIPYNYGGIDRIYGDVSIDTADKILDLVDKYEDLVESLRKECKMIKDSGNRTEFKTGAVRDIKESVGRCDLLPLREVAAVLQEDFLADLGNSIEDYKEGRIDTLHFYNDLAQAIRNFNVEVAQMNDSYDDTLEHMVLEVSMHFKEGAEKYGEYNWQKGIPCHSYVDSAIRHYIKWLALQTDERHDRAFVWNILCLMWTLKNKPEMDDLKAINLKKEEKGKEEI